MGLRLNVPVVKKFLDESEMSEYGLSKTMGLDKSFVHRVLRGKRGPGPKFINGIIRVTGMNFDELFILDNDMSVDKKAESSSQSQAG